MKKTRVYVSCAQSCEIQVFTLDVESGELCLLQSLPVAGAPLPLARSPDGRTLYAGLRNENAVQAFRIDSDGKISALGRLAAQGAPAYVACDKTQKWLFSASYASNHVDVFALDAEGVPTALVQTELDLPHAHAALTDATNRWLIVPMLGADAIRVYRLTDVTDERLPALLSSENAAVQQVRKGSGPRHAVFSNDNRHLYCLNELDGTIDHFAFDEKTGELHVKAWVSMLPPGFTGKPWAAELRLSATNRFLYATERCSSTIAAFAIDEASGALARIDHYPTQSQPRGMALDGHWLVAAGQTSNALSIYAIDAKTGGLTQKHTYPCGKDPICVEMLAV